MWYSWKKRTGTQKKDPTTVREERTTTASSTALMVSICTGTAYIISSDPFA
jgi:hypothetical protein